MRTKIKMFDSKKLKNNFGNPEKGKIKIRSHNENLEVEVNI